MRRIVIETQNANKFLTEVEALAAKNNLDIEINMDDIEVYIGFAQLLKAEIVDIDIPEVLQKPKAKQRGGRPKGGKKNNEISLREFKDAVNNLGKGTLVRNLIAAMEVTSLSKSFLSKLYYDDAETAIVDDRCYKLLGSLIKPERKFTDEETKKNAVMVRRVARAKETEDPYTIANTIMNSTNMQKQTTFKDVAEIHTFIQKHGTR